MMWHEPTRCRQNAREKDRIELSREAVWLANVDRAALLAKDRDASCPKGMAANRFGSETGVSSIYPAWKMN
jgi:hypothetical protein